MQNMFTLRRLGLRSTLPLSEQDRNPSPVMCLSHYTYFTHCELIIHAHLYIFFLPNSWRKISIHPLMAKPKNSAAEIVLHSPVGAFISANVWQKSALYTEKRNEHHTSYSTFNKWWQFSLWFSGCPVATGYQKSAQAPWSWELGAWLGYQEFQKEK